MQKVKTFFGSKKGKISVFIVGGIILALVIFQAGMFVGFKKASFSFRMGEQYFRQMKGGQEPFGGIGRDNFGNSHGAIGKIISVNLPLLVVSDKDGIEKTIIISTSTEIKKFKEAIQQEDLKVDDFVTVVGSPNDKSQVEARLIRIMPSPEEIPRFDLPRNN